MPFMFENLEVYRKSMSFVVAIYNTCSDIRHREIKDQLTRAALSIPLNIAEGQGRNTDREKAQFYKTARGSLFECVAILELTKKIGIISDEKHQSLYTLADEIGRMLNGLIRSVRK